MAAGCRPIQGPLLVSDLCAFATAFWEAGSSSFPVRPHTHTSMWHKEDTGVASLRHSAIWFAHGSSLWHPGGSLLWGRAWAGPWARLGASACPPDRSLNCQRLRHACDIKTHDWNQSVLSPQPGHVWRGRGHSLSGGSGWGSPRQTGCGRSLPAASYSGNGPYVRVTYRHSMGINLGSVRSQGHTWRGRGHSLGGGHTGVVGLRAIPDGLPATPHSTHHTRGQCRHTLRHGLVPGRGRVHVW